jgi:general secretion pathway protein B
MSILLDALKKSEEQRQLGAAPDIHSSAAATPLDMEDGHRWLPLSMMALSLVVMLWGGLKQLAESESLIPPEQVAGQEEPATSGPSRDSQVAQSPAEPAESVNQDLRTPVASLPAPVNGEQVTDEEIPGAAQRARLQDAVAGYRAEQPETAPEQEPAVETASAGPDLAVSEAQPRVGRAALADEPDGPHISAPISIYELPQRVRDNLPEIRITVLVFAREPDDRFLLVNGKRLREKENLESGVKLDEIRRDGAVFLYRNYRFMVKG